MTHMFYQETELLLCVLKLYEKSWPDRKLNFSGHTEVKVLRNDNELHFTKLSQKYILIMSI